MTRLLHILTDSLLLHIPHIIICQLQMPLGRKVRLISVFCVGFISSIASVATMILVGRIKLDITCELKRRRKPNYRESAAAIWDGIDVFFATIVASFPALNGVLGACPLRLKTWGVRTLGAPSQKPRRPNSGQWFRSSTAGGRKPRSFSQLEAPNLPGEMDGELQRPVHCCGNGKPF